jgi:hypothetical protein
VAAACVLFALAAHAGWSDWSESDFLTTGDTITGLSASGIAKLLVDTDVYIPTTFPTAATPVTKIGTDAFSDRALTGLHVPAGFTDIGKHAAYNCDLVKLELPTSITTIGEGAFMQNELADFDNKGTPATTDDTGFDFSTLSNPALTEIAKSAFRENRFTTLTLPTNITTLSTAAFQNNRLTTLVLPGVTTVGEYALANNLLTHVSLPAITLTSPTPATHPIADTAFDSNGRVVALSVTDNDPTQNSHFSGGSGFIINPVTITVTPADKDSYVPIGSPFISGNDYSSDVLYERGTTVAVAAPIYVGYQVVTGNPLYPAPISITGIGTNAADPDHESVTFLYEPATQNPTITASDRYINQSSAYTQTQILSWAAAVDWQGTTIATSTNPADKPALVIETIAIGSTYYGNQITTGMTTVAGTVIDITYKATDSAGNETRRSIKVTVDSDPMQAYIPRADGTASQWQYRDFIYVNETVTVQVTKYANTTAYYTESVTGLTVTGFSSTGNSKYGSNPAARADLVLPGIKADTSTPVVAISGTGAGGATKFNTKDGTNTPGAIDLSNMTALEIIGDAVFASPWTTDNTNPPVNTGGAYGDIIFGVPGARLTRLRAIGNNAFRWNQVVNLDLSGLTSLTIIGDFAFSDASSNTNASYGGNSLQSIDFSNLPSLVAIGDYTGGGGRTFMNSQLRGIDLSGAPNLEQIGIATFCAAGYTSVTIPAFPLDLSMLDKLKIIGQHAFRDYPISDLNISGMDSLERIDGQNFGHIGNTTLEIKDNPKLSVISPQVFNYSIATRTPLTTSTVLTLIIDNCDSLVDLHTSVGGASWGPSDHGFEDLPLTTLVITNNDSLATLMAPANTIKTSSPPTQTSYFQDMNLTGITIDNNDSLTQIGYRAFYNSQSTTLIIANNDALTDIGQEAFPRNRATALDLSTNPLLTTIGKNAFSQNNQGNPADTTYQGGSYLTSLNLTGLTHLDTIGNEAFANAKLTGTLDFSTNTALKNIGTRSFRSSPITDVVFPPSIELINIMAFAYYSGDSLVLSDLPALKILAAGAFGQYNTEGSPAPLQTMVLRNLPSLVNLNRADPSYNGTPVESTDYKAGATIETAYCMTNGADGIAGTNDDELQGSAIVGSIFGNSLPSMTTLTIDNVGLYGLPPKAFYGSPLTSLTIRNMPNLTNIGIYGDKQSDGITNVGTGAICNLGTFETAQLAQLTLDNLPQLRVIGNETFLNSPLESLTLTNLSQLQIIGERAFANATKLTGLDLSNLTNLEIIGDEAFKESPIETLNLAGDTALKKICYEAFYRNRLTTVDLSGLSALEIIGSRAFSDGSMPNTAYVEKTTGGGALITSLILQNNTSLRMIGSVDGGSLGDAYKRASYYLCGEGNRTFYGARLTQLDLSEAPNLESIGFAAFINSPIENLDFTGLNKLQYIGMLSFAAYAGDELTIKDLPALYEIGGLAFSAGRTTTNLRSLTLENLPQLHYLAEQQAFLYDSNGLLVTDFQGYNTTHYGLPYPIDTTNLAKKAYEQLTSLTLKNLPNLNCIPPYTFFASPLLQVTLEDLGIYAIGYDAFYRAQLSYLDLSVGLDNLATIDYQAFCQVPITQLNASNLPALKRIGAEAFLYSSLSYLDLTDSTDFVGFPTYTDANNVVHKSAFGSVSDAMHGSQLGYVLIGGIGADNTTDNLYAENFTTSATTTQNALLPPTRTVTDDSAMANVDQTFNRNNHVPVYILGNARAVTTQDGYIINPVNIRVNYVYIGDGDDNGPDPTDTVSYPLGVDDPQYQSDLAAWRASQPDSVPNVDLRPGRIVQAPYDAVNHTAVVQALDVAGYKLVASNSSTMTIDNVTFPSSDNLSDPDWVEPGNEFTFYYERDTTSQNAIYTLYESGVKIYDEIGKILETSWGLTNSSNDPNLAIGAGWTVQLSYDPLRVQFVGASSSNVYTYSNDPLAGIVTFTFTGSLPAGTFSPTCFWQLIPGRTEMDRDFPIYAALVTPEHTVTLAESTTGGGTYYGMTPGTVVPGRPVAEARPIVYLRGMYRTPDFVKSARPINKPITTKAPQFPTGTDDVANFEASWSSTESAFYTYDDFTMIYTLKAGVNRSFNRNVADITYTDTLPIYYVNDHLLDGDPSDSATGSKVRTIATFDPAKNPGWEITEVYELGPDGIYGTADDGRTWVYVADPDGNPATADGPFVYYQNFSGPTTQVVYTGSLSDLTATKVSYTYDKLCTTTPPSATLILDFPYAWDDHEFVNNASYVASVYRPLYGDMTQFSGADSIKSLVVGVPIGNFTKQSTRPHETADSENGTDGLNVIPASPAVAAGELDDTYAGTHEALAPEPIAPGDGQVIIGRQGWFYDSAIEKNQSPDSGVGEQRWDISVAGRDENGVDLPEGSYFKNLIFIDTLYDSRLRFKGASVNDFAPAVVTAYASDGSILFQQMVSQRINFPTDIRDAIYKVTVSNSLTTVRSGQEKSVLIFTELRDPSITWEGIMGGTSVAHNDGTEYGGGAYDPVSRTADDYFWNLGEVTRTLVQSSVDPETGNTVFTQSVNHADQFDTIRIHNQVEGLGIEKFSSVPAGNPFIAGDAVDYTIKLDTFNAETGAQNSDCRGVDMELDNVVIIDVLPPCYNYTKFTPATQLVLASSDGPDADDLAYTVQYVSDGFIDNAGKKYDIIRIEIDHLKVSELYTTQFLKDVTGNAVAQSGVVGKISGYIDQSAGAMTVLNRVFMDYDATGATVVKVGTDSESYTPARYVSDPNTGTNIDNPQYNVNDEISNGIVDGNNPFHATPTPADDSDDILVGTDVGVTGATRQLIAQKSIRTKVTSTSYGAWQTTPPSRDGRPVQLAGVSTGGVAATWAYDYQYRLRVQNNTDPSVHEDTFEILDILPHVGDHTIIPDNDGVWAERNSEFADELVGVRVPAGYTVEFLVSNPATAIPADLGDIAQPDPGNLTNVIGTPDGVKDAADVQYWFENPPAGYTWYTGVINVGLSTVGVDATDYFLLADLAGGTIDPAAVRAIRIKGTPALRVLENTPLDIIVDMHAPLTGTEVGMRAINNFVWKCNTQNRYLEVPSVYNQVPPFAASVHVKKVAGGTNAALAGAKFGLYAVTDEGTEELLQVKTSNAAGELSYTEVVAGEYVIREISAPAGYDICGDSWNVTVLEKAVPWDYYVSAVPISVYTDADGDGIPDCAGLDGIVGTADDTGNPTTADAVGTPQPSSFGSVGVWAPGADGILDAAHGGVQAAVSTDDYHDANGWNAGPDGILDAAHGGVQAAVSADDIYQTPAAVSDPPLPTRLRLQKVGLNEAGTVSTGPLSGAKFGLYSNAACTAASLIAEQTTNSGGFAIWEGLAPGTYYVRETQAPAGYDPVSVATPIYTVTIPGGSAHVDDIALDAVAGGAIDPVTNMPDVRSVVRGNLTLAKVDGVNGDALAGATFKVTRGPINLYSDYLVGSTNPARLQTASEWKSYTGNFSVSASGTVSINGLLTLGPGMTGAYDMAGGVVYTVEELVAPTGLDRVKFDVVVYPDHCAVVAGSVSYWSGTAWVAPATAELSDADLAYDSSGLFSQTTTVTVVNSLASVNVAKRGIDLLDQTLVQKPETQLSYSDGVALAGVEFELWRDRGIAGVTADDAPMVGSAVADASGKLSFKHLQVGVVYYLSEVASTVPAGYAALTDPVPFMLDATGAVHTVTSGGALGTSYDSGAVMIKNYPIPVPARLKLTKTTSIPTADGTVAAGDLTSSGPLPLIRFYIEKRNDGSGVFEPYVIDAGVDMMPGTADDVTWITTSDGTAGAYDLESGVGSSYTDDQGTLSTADDTTESLAVGQAWLAGLTAGTYRITEQPVADAPMNGAYLTQTVTRTLVVGVTQLGTAPAYSYDFNNTPVTPVMVKGDYVGTFDPTDSYSQAQLQVAYQLLEDPAGDGTAPANDSDNQHPHQMLRSDGKVDLIAGLGGATFLMSEYTGTSPVPANLVGTWLVTSRADGSFDFTSTVSTPVAGVTFAGFDQAKCYSFVEVTPPAGYELNATPVYYYPAYDAATMRTNGGKWISLENKVVKHKLTVSKYAADTKDSLANTEFALYYPDGTLVLSNSSAVAYATFMTDSSGVLQLPDLPTGTYYLKEIAAPAVGGDANYYEVKTGYYRIVIDGKKDVGAAAPESAHQTDALSPFTGDPANFTYDGTDTLNPNYAGPAAAGRTQPYDLYTNAYNYIYPDTLVTSGDAYAVVYDRRTVDPFPLTIAKQLYGADDAANPDRRFYFRVEFDRTELDGAGNPLPDAQQVENWEIYSVGSPYTLYQSDQDDVGSDGFVMAGDVIAIKVGQHATIAAGLPIGTRYRVTETDASGAVLPGWAATVVQTVPDDTVLPHDADSDPDLIDVTPDTAIDANGDGDYTDPGDVPPDRVSGQLVVLDTHGDADPSNDEGHQVVTFTNQKSTDLDFTKYFTANGMDYPLAGAEFTLYRCSVLADGDPTNDAAHLAAGHDEAGSTGDCWEAWQSQVSTANGTVHFDDLTLYGDDGSGQPYANVYVLAETGTPAGYTVPFGYWEITIDPYQATADARIVSITAHGKGNLQPPAFESGNYDGDATNGNELRLRNDRRATLPMTGGLTRMWVVWVIGMVLIIAGVVAWFLRPRRKGDGTDTGQNGQTGQTAMGKVLTVLLPAILLAAAVAGTVFAGAAPAAAAPTHGSITIYKYQVDDRTTAVPNATGQPSDIYSYSGGSEPVAGARFRLVHVVAGGTASTALFSYDGEYYIAATGAAAYSQTATTDSAGKASFGTLPLGLYLVTELSGTGTIDIEPPFMVQIPTAIETIGPADDLVYDVTVYPKAEPILIHKSYAEHASDGAADGWQDGSANIGDTVLWKVASTVPVDIAHAQQYTVDDYYQPGLSVDADGVRIRAWATEGDLLHPPLYLVAGVDYVLTVTGDGAAGTTVSYTLTPAGQQKVDGYRVLELYVPTKLLENIALNTAVDTPARLTYVDASATRIVLDTENPEVHTGVLGLKKVDAKSSKKSLAGARFRLVKKLSDDYAADYRTGGYVQREGADWEEQTNASGLAFFRGLAYGEYGDANGVAASEYWLVEVAAPAGYIKPTEPAVVRVSAAGSATTAAYRIANTAVPAAQPIQPPKTGESITLLIAMIAAIAIGAGLLVMQKRLKGSTFEGKEQP